MLFSSVGIHRHCVSRGFSQHGGMHVKRPRVALVPSRAQPCSPSDLPPELQGLSLNDEGLLVDEKTGEVINEYGATRFDVAVRAMRGEFDPAPNVENTERTPGLLLDSLMQFPAVYTFNLVVKAEGRPSQELLAEMAALVARVTQAEVRLEDCTAKERKGGKYVSLALPAMVRAPEIVHQVFGALEGDARVLMKY